MPPSFVEEVVQVFRNKEEAISTLTQPKGLESDQVLSHIRDGLLSLGFEVEQGKGTSGTISRPVLFGENGKPEVMYEIDGYNPMWKAVLEVEAGRAWKGNAVYRDLIRVSVMTNVDFLFLAVPNGYRYKRSGKPTVNKDYELTASLLDTVYGHDSFRLPYGTVLIGY